MVASLHLEIAYYRGIGRQARRESGAIAQAIWRTAIPILREDVVPAAKCVIADSWKFLSQKLHELLVVEEH